MRAKLNPSIKERILAFLDLAILRMLQHESMTAYEIDNSILEKFGGKRSPNVVYTKLSSMERENLICCAQSKHGRVYSITENGKETAEDMPRIIQETQSLTSILLKS